MFRRLREMLEGALGTGRGNPPAWPVSPHLRIVLEDREGVPVLRFENGDRAAQPLVFTEVRTLAQAEAVVEYVRDLRMQADDSVTV